MEHEAAYQTQKTGGQPNRASVSLWRGTSSASVGVFSEKALKNLFFL